MAEIKITNDNFESEVLQSDIPVLLDFWADWCGPCRMLAPELEELAAENEGKLKIGKVNVDDEPELATAFQVMSIPMIVIVKNGQVVKTAVGYRPKQELELMLK